MLEITKQQDGSHLTIALSGRLDTDTAPGFDKDVSNMPEEVTDFTLDLADLAYISSAGLRVLLRASKIMDARGGTFVCTNASDLIKETFEMTGLMDILTVE